MKFSDWLEVRKDLVESVGAEKMVDAVCKKWTAKLDTLRIAPDYGDDSKCKDHKEAHNSILRKVQNACRDTVEELSYLPMSRGKATVMNLVVQLQKLYKMANDNADESKMPGGCPIPSPFMSLKNPGVGEKLRDLASYIRYLIEDLEKLNFNAVEKSPVSAAEPEEGGLMSKLFGKKGWLNPDAYARPVRRPLRPR
jgi:hypothetical protein